MDKYLISQYQTIRQALQKLNQLVSDLNLFVIDNEGKLVGSVTDGDIRRGIISGAELDDPVKDIMHISYSYLEEDNIDLSLIIKKRREKLKMLPIINSKRRVVDVLNFRKQRTLLPMDAVIMAGGEGRRLLPLTQNVPKPLLEVGGKPIISYGIDRMRLYGIKKVSITVNYLKEQLKQFAQVYSKENRIVECECIEENQPLGTIGALRLIPEWQHEYILLTNSDLLTNIDYEDFFMSFIESGADMMVAGVPYSVKIPYAIMETEGQHIKAFKEKPEYTYYANTGMYILSKKLLQLIPDGEFFNATDLMDKLLLDGYKLSYYPMVSYWLDIGKHDDYKKAQEDIKHLKI